MFEFFKKAFHDMKQSAAAQHEVDKAEFEAVKASSRANFEENRGHNSMTRAKANAQKCWDEARLSSSARVEKERSVREQRIAAAKKATEEANLRYENAKVAKKEDV